MASPVASSSSGPSPRTPAVFHSNAAASATHAGFICVLNWRQHSDHTRTSNIASTGTPEKLAQMSRWRVHETKTTISTAYSDKDGCLVWLTVAWLGVVCAHTDSRNRHVCHLKSRLQHADFHLVVNIIKPHHPGSSQKAALHLATLAMVSKPHRLQKCLVSHPVSTKTVRRQIRSQSLCDHEVSRTERPSAAAGIARIVDGVRTTTVDTTLP